MAHLVIGIVQRNGKICDIRKELTERCSTFHDIDRGFDHRKVYGHRSTVKYT